MEKMAIKKRYSEFQPHLPVEIIMEILSRLPVRFLPRCRFVCKEWNTFINDPVFLNMHHSRINEKDSSFLVFFHDDRNMPKFYLADYKVEETGNATNIWFDDLPSRMKLVGSSNGLICFCSYPYLETFYIINPIIEECLKLPKVPSRVTTVLPPFRNKRTTTTPVGFGYDASSKTYKIVHTWWLEDQTGVEIYTLGTKMWRRRTENISICIQQESSQVILNGALHWAITEPKKNPYRSCVGVLDLATEKFKTFKAPTKKFDTKSRSLGLLRGCLCMVDFIGTVRLKISVWIMKNYEAKSWSIERVIEKENVPVLWDDRLPFQSFRIVSDTSMLLLGHMDKGHYDLKKKEFKKLKIKAIPSCTDCLDVVAHVGSFISPRSIHGREIL